MDQAPVLASATVVPTEAAPAKTSMVLPGMAVPLNGGESTVLFSSCKRRCRFPRQDRASTARECFDRCPQC